MTREILNQATPTARVTILCLELLSDGRPHSRKEIEQYVKSQLHFFGFQAPTRGHLSGGIRSVAQKENCNQPQRAIYQLTSSAPTVEMNRKERICNYLNAAIDTITAIAHEIDFITASEAELEELKLYKEGLAQMREFAEKTAVVNS